MDHRRTPGMSEALRLTRAGRLSEALAQMQRWIRRDAVAHAGSAGAFTQDHSLLGKRTAKPSAAEAAAAPGGEIRRLNHAERAGYKKLRPLHPHRLHGRAGAAWSSCCTAANRTPLTSPQAPG